MTITRETEARGLPGKLTAQPRQDETPTRASAPHKATTMPLGVRQALWRAGWQRILTQPTEQCDAL